MSELHEAWQKLADMETPTASEQAYLDNFNRGEYEQEVPKIPDGAVIGTPMSPDGIF